MYISRKLKETNIAEYLLYMWQVEDMIRANGLGMEMINKNIISQYRLKPEEKEALAAWYESLILMMHEEGVVRKGHLQINKNVLNNLTELHIKLLHSPKYPFYSSAYYKALPFIVELRRKSGQTDEAELDTCFQALYGVMLLRLGKKEVTEGTQKAVEVISAFLSMLANYYEKDRKGELEF